MRGESDIRRRAISSRRVFLGAAAACVVAGAGAVWALRSGPESSGAADDPRSDVAARKLGWSDLRPKQAEIAALRARVEAIQRGDFSQVERSAPGASAVDGGGLAGLDTRPLQSNPLGLDRSAGGAGGLGGVRGHSGAAPLDWMDGGALDTSPSADGPFSWGVGSMPSPADLVTELDGARVALPGYAVPLELDEDGAARQFLLAPYVGACIHVPPPPANQIVLVDAEAPYAFNGMFEPVLVTGEMRVEPTTSRLAVVGYRIEAVTIRPFDTGREGANWPG